MNVKREISDRALEKGKECLKEEEYSQALTCFRRAHKLNPSGQDVLFEIGKVEFVLGKYAQARGVFEALLAGKYDNSHVRIFLAKIYNQLSQSGKVLQLLEPWIAAGHYGPELHKELGKAYLRTGNTASALVQFRQAEKEGGDGLNWEWATLYRSQGKYRQAIKQLREFLKKGKDREKARVELGKNYFGLREFEKAGKEFREALRVKPDDGHIHAELGLVYEKTGFIGKAVESFETAWQKGIRNEFVQSRLMDLYRKGFAGQGSSYRIRKILEEIHRGDLNAFARNEIENEVEITEQKNFLSSKPRSLIVTLTTACNLDCLMCGRPRALWDLPRKTREEIKGFFPYLNRIIWRGGEVFCTDYFEALFDAAAGYPDLEQYISTNGLLVDERWARKLVSSRGGLCYSIDGLRRATYENIRKGGRFDDLIRSVERIKNHQAGKKSKNFEFSLNFVVMRSNYREVPEILDFARKYGFQAVQLFPIQGNYAENMFLKPAPGEMNFLREAVCGLKDKSKLYNIHLHSCIPISGGNNAGRVSRKKGGSAAEKKNMFCYHPWQSLFIDNLGTVFPHCFCVKPVGNADKNTLDEIWNNAGMRSCRRKMAGGAIDGFCNPLCLSGALKEQDLRGFLR